MYEKYCMYNYTIQYFFTVQNRISLLDYESDSFITRFTKHVVHLYLVRVIFILSMWCRFLLITFAYSQRQFAMWWNAFKVPRRRPYLPWRKYSWRCDRLSASAYAQFQEPEQQTLRTTTRCKVRPSSDSCKTWTNILTLKID